MFNYYRIYVSNCNGRNKDIYCMYNLDDGKYIMELATRMCRSSTNSDEDDIITKDAIFVNKLLTLYGDSNNVIKIDIGTYTFLDLYVCNIIIRLDVDLERASLSLYFPQCTTSVRDDICQKLSLGAIAIYTCDDYNRNMIFSFLPVSYTFLKMCVINNNFCIEFVDKLIKIILG